MTYRYVPMLRTKAGEVTAISHLASVAKDRMFPIFHVVTTPPSTFAARLVSTWAPRAMALDGLFNFATTGTTTTFAAIFAELRRGGVDVIPCIEQDADPTYVAAAKKLIDARNPRLVVKTSLPQLPKLQAWVTTHGWAPSSVDLIVSVGPLAEVYSPLFVDYVRTIMSGHVPNVGAWATITLASAAAPKDHSQLAPGRNDVPRSDWQLWSSVHSHVGYQLDYGDHAVSHPDLTEPPGVAMARATVSVRYTVDDKWIVLKGTATSGRTGRPMAAQYKAHAQTLHSDPEFGNLATSCWADQRIAAIATTAVSSGNRATWVEIGVNRHLSLVADRLP